MENPDIDTTIAPARQTQIDEAMLPFSEFVDQMTTQIEGFCHDPATQTTLVLEQVNLSMPLQLDLQVLDDGRIELGGSPPLYYADTTILPVFHQLKVTINVTHGS